MKLKPSQNKKGRKKFLAAPFLNLFSQLSAVKNYSKMGAARKFFGPSYFVTALTLSEPAFFGVSHGPGGLI